MATKNSNNPLPCSISSPQYLTIGESRFRTGCAIIEIQFPKLDSTDIGKITFVNNYTAHITVKMKIRGDSSHSKVLWKTAIKQRKLMSNPHCEDGSQSYFVLNREDFQRPPSSVAAIRLILHQPSPNWKTFTLEEIYIYPPSDPETINAVVPKWLLRNDEKHHKAQRSNDGSPGDLAKLALLPHPHQLSQHLQQLWMLAEKAEECTPSVDLGRFDIDGCYEVNLLSYT